MPCYCIGLDLGQVRDYSALVLTERVEVFDETHTEPRRRWAFPDDPDDAQEVYDEHRVRYIKRWTLGTDYTQVADDVADLFREPALEYALLSVDRTGVGGGIADMLTQHYLDGRLGRQRFRPVTLTAGVSSRVRDEGYAWTTAHKGDVVARLLSLAQRSHLKVAADLAGGEALTKELRAFQLKQNARTGNVRFEAKREADHDDLVIALALSVWFTNHLAEARFVALDGSLQEKPGSTASVMVARR